MIKRLFAAVSFVVFSLPALAQNWATVSASNITDLNQQKLAAGQICFLATDQSDTPISFQAGGGGQVLKRAFCSAVNAGVATAFTVPNPALASPSGIYYRVTVRDSSTGQEVLRYPGVTFSGATFNFDSYTPVLSGASLAPLSGTSVSGNLGVTGNVSATGTITGSNIPASIAGTGSCAGQHVSVLNASAGPTCSANYSNVVTITGSTGLAASGTGGQMAGGFPSPSIRRDYIGDGTGWRMEWAKRSASTDTLEAWITDGGVFNAAGGFQFNGGAPSGNVLRGTGTSFVASQLNFSDLAGAAAISQGGTGQTTAAAAFNALAPMTTLGDMVYESAANTASRLAGNTTTTKKYLSQTGTGTASAAPAWAQIAAADLSDGNTGTGAIVHASSPALATPSIGGETISHAPRFALYGAREFDNSLAFVTDLSWFFPVQAITLERIIALEDSQSTGCTTLPVVQVTNGTTTQSLTLGNGANSFDSGPLALNFPAGVMIKVKLSTGVAGCTAAPQGLHVVAQFLMQ